jgi:hypothetical protein
LIGKRNADNDSHSKCNKKCSKMHMFRGLKNELLDTSLTTTRLGDFMRFHQPDY